MSKKGKHHTYRSKEFKLNAVRKVLEGKSSNEVGRELDVRGSQVRDWVRLYQSGGELALESKRKPGNPFARYVNRKQLSEVEQLRYALAKAEVELAKLKKEYELQRR